MGVVPSASPTVFSPHDKSNYSSLIAFPKVEPEIITLVILVFVVMAFVILADAGFQCLATLTWLKTKIMGFDSDGSKPATNQGSAIISHSLPDLQSAVKKEEYVQDNKPRKVLRQTTLPTVPLRHQVFQRQLSQPLNIPSVQFSICRLEDRGDSYLGLIQPELYEEETKRRRSSDSITNDDLQYAGKLHFALRYDADIEGLMVKVLEARDLPAKDNSSHTDPYIKVYLLPDRKKRFQTKVRRKNLNPVFNETFIFSVCYEDLQHRYLQFSVYDFDRFSRHDLIGQVVLKGLLNTTDLLKEIEYTMDIICLPQEKKGRGQLMLSLCYLPTAGRLTVTVVKARNLIAMDLNGKSDPFVKIYLLYRGKRLKKKKTTIKKSTLSPVYNEAFVFDVPSANVEDVCLILKVLDHDKIGYNEFLGCVAVGNKFMGIGRDHWLEMLDNPRKPVAQWYSLLDSLPGNFDLKPSASSQNILGGCLNSRERLKTAS